MKQSKIFLVLSALFFRKSFLGKFKIVLLLILLCSCGNGNKARIVNYRVPGSLETTHQVGCVGIEKISNKYTPPDLYNALAKCINEEKYDYAIDIFSLAGVYGIFDTNRVEDKTAHQAISVIRMNTLLPLDQNKVKRFQGYSKATYNNHEKLDSLCSRIQKVGLPDYYPGYMVLHGMNAITGKGKKQEIVDNFNPNVTWNKILISYLHCSL